MNRIAASLLLVLLSACAEKQSQTDEKILDAPSYFVDKPIHSIGPNGESKRQDDQSERSERSFQISGNSIKVLVEKAGIKVVELPEAIKTSLMLKTFRRVAFSTTVDKLRDECQSMNYKAQKYHFISHIRGALNINPFTSWDIKMALDRQSVPFVPGKLPGALDATDARTEIIASYLTESELASLKAWFDSYLLLDKKAFDFEISDDLDDLTPPRVPIMELSRLVCGILFHEARIDFVLSTGNGRTLRVKVDNVTFDH